MRLVYRVAYRGLQAWTFVRRPRVRGTMVAVVDARGNVILVRHTYGDRARWELPGGWIRGDEAPMDAARREVREELGIEVTLGALTGVLEGDWDFKREALSWFVADWPGGRGTYDPVEIAEVAWFPLDTPPAHVGIAAGAVLERLAAERRR